jgi:hypothetical protein
VNFETQKSIVSGWAKPSFGLVVVVVVVGVVVGVEDFYKLRIS